MPLQLTIYGLSLGRWLSAHIADKNWLSTHCGSSWNKLKQYYVHVEEMSESDLFPEFPFIAHSPNTIPSWTSAMSRPLFGSYLLLCHCWVETLENRKQTSVTGVRNRKIGEIRLIRYVTSLSLFEARGVHSRRFNGRPGYAVASSGDWRCLNCLDNFIQADICSGSVVSISMLWMPLTFTAVLKCTLNYTMRCIARLPRRCCLHHLTAA